VVVGALHSKGGNGGENGRKRREVNEIGIESGGGGKKATQFTLLATPLVHNELML